MRSPIIAINAATMATIRFPVSTTASRTTANMTTYSNASRLNVGSDRLGLCGSWSMLSPRYAGSRAPRLSRRCFSPKAWFSSVKLATQASGVSIR